MNINVNIVISGANIQLFGSIVAKRIFLMDGEDGKLTEKLYKMIMSWTDGIKVRGFQTPSLATFRELVRIYKEIKAGGHPDFIDGESKKVLEKCGFQLEPCGIGWIADNAKQGDFSGETKQRRIKKTEKCR